MKMSKILICASSICIFSYTLNKLFPTNRATTIMAESPESLTELFVSKPEIEGKKCFPIVYNESYDISFWNLESFHNFDTRKWGKIHNKIKEHFQSNNQNFTSISPLRPISMEELGLIHTQKFIQEIHSSQRMIANAAEVFILRFIPISILQQRLLLPLKWQTAGSILAAKKALQHGWSVNLGGGFHHSCAHSAEGFCFFADISLIMKILWHSVNEKLRYMIIDLDAHQGNGYARDVLIFPQHLQQQVYIFDMFNPTIYPNDNVAKRIISRMVEIYPHIADKEYLNTLEVNMNEALNEFQPDLIIYNAGTDILSNDPLGKLNVSSDGIKLRDEMVFKIAKDRSIPIVMLMSGGYQHSNAEIIANSLINLYNKNLIY